MCMFYTLDRRACRNRTCCKDYCIRCKLFYKFRCHFCIHKNFHIMTFYFADHHIFKIAKIRFVDIHICKIQQSAKFIRFFCQSYFMSAFCRSDGRLDTCNTATYDQNLLRTFFCCRKLLNVKWQMCHRVNGTVTYIYSQLFTGKWQIIIAFLRGTRETFITS